MPISVRQLAPNGVTPIQTYDWGISVAGQNQTPAKFGVHNSGSRALDNLLDVITAVPNNDGASMMTIALDSSAATPTLSPPWAFAAALSGAGAGGVWGSIGVYGYRITSTNATGESGPQDEITINVDVVTKKVTLTWAAVTGATGYKIYRTSTPGTYGATTLRTTIVGGGTVTFVDDGSAASSGTPPTYNSSGGWLPTAVLSAPAAGGVWSGTGVKFWKIVAYDSTGIEISNTIEISVNVDNTTKTVALTWASAAASLGGASSIKVFRSTVSGVYTTPALVTTLAGSATSYTDTGTATTTGAWTGTPLYGLPPASGNFVTPQILLSSGVASAQIGEEFYYWVQRTIPGGTTDVGDPRLAQTLAQES